MSAQERTLAELPGIVTAGMAPEPPAKPAPEPAKETPPATEEKPVEFKEEPDEPLEPDIFKGITADAFKDRYGVEPKEPVKEEVKEEPAKEETALVKRDATLPVKKTVVERDLSFADDADKPLFKQMSNEAFERLSVVYKKHKEDSAKLVELQSKSDGKPSDSIFAHEQGYLLTPEYQVLSERARLATQLSDHWEQQLINIRNGKQWTAIVNDKDGNIIETEPQAASEEAEVKVLKALRYTTSSQERLTNELSTYVGKHKDRFTELNQFVSKTIEQYFPGYEKPDHPTANIQKVIYDNLPEAMKSELSAKLLKVTGAANAVLRAQLQAKDAEIAKLKGIKEDVAGAPPPASALKAGGASKNATVIDFNDFKKRE